MIGQALIYSTVEAHLKDNVVLSRVYSRTSGTTVQLIDVHCVTYKQNLLYHVGALCITCAGGAGEIIFYNLYQRDRSLRAKHVFPSQQSYSIAYASCAQRCSRWEGDTEDNCTVSSERIESIFIHAIRAWSFTYLHRQAHRHTHETEDITLAPWLLASLFLCFTHVAAIQALKIWAPVTRVLARVKTETPISPAVRGWLKAVTFVES